MLVLFLNLAVAFAKIIYGTLSGALSMTADGYHSLFDGVSNIVGLIGSFIAARPPDKEHPYGHHKYETVASIFISLLLLYVGFEIFRNAFDRFLVRSVPEVTAISFLIILGTMCINYLVTHYEYRQGLSLKSQVLIADSLHTKSDIYVSLSVIVSLAAVRLGFPLLDPVIALLISLIIFRAGFRIMKESSKVLLDMSRLEEEEICRLALGVEGVLGCHKIRTRGGMGDIRIDMHVLVQPDMPLEEAHLIAHRVSKMLKAEYEDVTDVVVHLEPALPQGSNTKKNQLRCMAGNVFGQMFQITTWGESHGRAVGVVVDGLPAGLPFSEADIQKELDRRRPGQSEVSTPRNEADRVEILSGIFEGMSTGTPISMLVWNSDARSSSYDAIKNTPRPGHADFTYMARYGIRDHRGGGRSSARETIGRVAGGALAKLLLSHFGIRIAGHVLELGGIRAKPLSFEEILENVEKTPVRCADPEAAKKMLERVAALRQEGDSVGGIVELIIKGVPAGLGEPVFDRLDADFAKALMSIPAVKGFEIGAGFEAARMRGSEMNDSFRMEDGKITCPSNNAGGILGGISTGLDIVCRAAVKPTPSISKLQQTVDLTTLENTDIVIKGRHDPTIPPRMVPVAEAMVALALADHMLRSGFINPRTLLE